MWTIQYDCTYLSTTLCVDSDAPYEALTITCKDECTHGQKSLFLAMAQKWSCYIRRCDENREDVLSNNTDITKLPNKILGTKILPICHNNWLAKSTRENFLAKKFELLSDFLCFENPYGVQKSII